MQNIVIFAKKKMLKIYFVLEKESKKFQFFGSKMAILDEYALMIKYSELYNNDFNEIYENEFIIIYQGFKKTKKQKKK